MDIREYESNDLEQFISLMADWGHPSLLEDMKVRMERVDSNPNCYTFVAEKEKVLVGMIGITSHTTYTSNKIKIQITALVTKKEYRSQGIAKSLVKHVEEWAIRRGANFIYLFSGISEERVQAHELYKLLGYEITGYRFIKNLER
ncbi:GNAT family N-acetyltransferase [Bacillus sp. SCS-151]|uniref:GNAT family N-acetyltransferase n=1 Tax=Nanhaiella sioensis TaxID=3115293 RepID=UPI00397C80D3